MTVKLTLFGPGIRKEGAIPGFVFRLPFGRVFKRSEIYTFSCFRLSSGRGIIEGNGDMQLSALHSGVTSEKRIYEYHSLFIRACYLNAGQIPPCFAFRLSSGRVIKMNPNPFMPAAARFFF